MIEYFTVVNSLEHYQKILRYAESKGYKIAIWDDQDYTRMVREAFANDSVPIMFYDYDNYDGE